MQKKSKSNPKRNRLSLLALESRMVFDGALAVTGAEDLTQKTTSAVSDIASALDRALALPAAPVAPAEPAAGLHFLQLDAASSKTAQAAAEVENKVLEILRSDNWTEQLFPIFSGGQTRMNDAWLASAQAFRDNVLSHGLGVAVQLVPASQIIGIDGAYAAAGPDGRPVIYLNEERYAQLGDAFAVRVLLEETGHWIDNQINGATDSQGDEGERFADTVLNVQLSDAEQARIATENDHLNLTIDGRDVQVEMASLMFNGQSYFAGITAKSGVSTTGPDGQNAQLESNTLIIGNALPGTRALFVSDPPDAAYYSGNNVRGNLYAIDANNNIVGKYYGEISRLIKIGSAPVSAQMYIYPTSDPAVTNINATTIIVDFYSTAPTFRTGDIVKTSSDPVASALNSLLPVNQAPTAVADVSAALEAGGFNNTTDGSNATGNVIANSDTDPNSTYVVDLVNNKVLTVQDSLSLTKISNASAGSTATLTAGSTSTTGGSVVAGLYGALTMGADGSYNYVVNNSLAAVQALRGTTNTLTETWTYTVTDGKGGFSTTTLTITVKGANDNPVAKDDYNFAKESIESTTANQYASVDVIGAKATGNVLPNDTDVDAYGETKTVYSLLASATGQTDGPTVLNFAAGVPSSVKVGFYVFTSASPLTPLTVNGVQVTVSSIVGNNVSLSADAKLTTGGTLYFSSSNTSITSNGGSATYTAAAPSTGTGVSVSLATDGFIAKGMTVSGSGVTVGTTVTAVTYDATGKVTGVTLSQNASIPAGTALTFEALAGSTVTGHYGTLVLNADGSYVYTPFANNPALNPGDQVLDEFRYRMKDAAGATSDATLHITVLGSGPSDPNANADTVSATEAGGTANGTAGTNPTSNLLTNDTLGVGATAGLSVVGAKTADVATVTSLSTGSVSYNGTNYDAKVVGKYGDLYLKADGTYLYAVNNALDAVQALKTGDTLAETFQYKITNGAGFDWSALTVTINGAYDAPVAVNDSNVAIVGQYVPVGSVVLNDTDVDAGDTKTVTKIALGSTLGATPSTVASSSTYTSSYTEVQGTYGKLRIGADGSYTYLVDATNAAIIALGTGQQLANPDVFTYEVKDANGLVSTARLTMNVEGRNDPPVNAYPTSTLTVQEGSTWAFTGGSALSASDVDANLASVTISVANGTLRLTETSSTGSAQTLETILTGGATIYGSEAGSPNGTSSITLYGTQAQINAALATLIYTPNPGYVGSDTLTIQSIDAESLMDTDTVALTVAAPALTVTGTTVNEASPYTLFTVSGKEGQWVSLSLGNTSTTSDKDATLGTDTSLTMEYFNGTSWVAYNPAVNGGYVTMPSNGNAVTGEAATLLVRVANVNDTSNEGAETLQLTATNAAAVSATGVSTIVDDGTGSWFAANNNTATPTLPSGVVLDDDRPLAVSSVTVNEGSPYATFTVTGAANQLASLALTNGTSTGLSGLQYYDAAANSGAGAWVPYTSGNVALNANGSLLVRTALTAEQETAVDNGETFTITATNTGGTSATGQGTIKDDGTGSWFDYASASTSTPLTAPAASTLDDDRVLTVNSISVNEASPYATFTVTGAAGQWVSLALGNTSSTSDVDATLNTDTGNAGTSVPLQYFNGTNWVDYTPGSRVQVPGTGTTLLVRAAITPDTGYEGAETFTLTATNTGGTGATGTAIILDDGTGSIYKYSSTATSTPLASTDVNYPVLDDDRLLTVSSLTVNEGSPYAVFTVTGATGQTVKLNLDNAAATNPATDSTGGNAALGTTLPALEYFEGGVWKTYDATNPPKISSSATTLLVRVAISAEQEAALDGPETFNLVATNTGGTAASGTATIVDNGTGDYFAASNNTATSNVPTGVVLDDDRPVTITNPFVNEASPYAVFTLDGEPGQLVSLNLAAGSATATADYQGKVEYSTDGGVTWTLYTGGNVALNGTGGTMLARVPIVNDSTQEPDETFTLTATNTGGTAVVGTATIQDDGNGTIFDANGAVNNTAVKDDDRPLAVSSLTVNEGSPYAVFTVTGAANQLATLTLANGTSSGLSGLEYYDAAANSGAGGWVSYTSGNVALNGSGSLLVRTALTAEQEAAVDSGETFTLKATNTGGTAATGQATIKDDGTGDYFAANGNSATSSVPGGVLLDDDRPLTVDNITVNEGTDFAVFTVTGGAGQYVKLALGDGTAKVDANGTPLTDGTEDYGPALQYWDGDSWENYTAGAFVQIPVSGTTLLVRTAIVHDAVDEGAQTFTLTATNTGLTDALGTATIKDDGTGTKWTFANPTTSIGTAATGPGAGFDDDRVVTVTSPLVNEASPYAVFTVDGAQGQLVSLSLGTGTASSGTDYTASMEISTDGGLTWSAYSSGLTSLDGTGGTLLVRVPVKQDTTDEPGETFTLTATKTNAVATTGTATIVDDGNGDIFNADGSLNTTTVKDDDRPVTVTSVAVNEASPYAVLTVDGELNQLVSLSLVAGATNPATAAADYQSKIEYSTDNGGTWTVYTGGNVALAGTNGTMLVRVPVVNDTTQEVDETFRLVATNTGGTSSLTTEGVVTIQDDGNGTIFNANGTENTSAIKDDDRPLTVSNETVNEAAGPAVFTVTGVAGQLVKLELQSTGSGSGDALISGGGADIGSTLRYSLDGGATWLTYNPATNGGFVAMTGTTMKVEVVVNRDALVESSETFQLAATNTGGSTALGTGTITDYAPPVTAVTSTAGEAGGTNNATAGTPVASGDLATGVELYSLKFGTAAAVTSPASGTTYVDGAFGRLTFAKDGTWSYAATEGDTDVQALRLTSNTLTETFTYTVIDAYGAKSSNTLSITIQGANDAPVANPDYNTAKESLLADGNAAQYTSTDPLGYKAVGNVFPNDTDVDAGDSKSIVGLDGSAAGTTVAASVLVFNSAPGSNVKAGYYVFLTSGTSANALLDANGKPIQISPTYVTGSTNVTLSGTVTYKGTVATPYTLPSSATFYFAKNADGSSSGGTATYNSTSSATGTTVSLGSVTGSVLVGMSVSGDGVTPGTTVVGVSRDAIGNVTGIELSQSASLSNKPLTFTAASGATVTGVYGTLVFDANAKGGYTYTPFAITDALSEGMSREDVFTYKMQDAGTPALTSVSTLTITVLGSGSNDPNAVQDTNSVTEAVDSSASTTVSTTSVNGVLSNDTTPAGTNFVSAVRAQGASAFTAVSTATTVPVTPASTTVAGLYGNLTIFSDGHYDYALTNTNAQVQALNAGQTLTEQFQYEVKNGQTATTGNVGAPLIDVATLTITINGANDSPVLDLDVGNAGSSNFAATFTEGGSAVSLINGADLNLTDVDSTTFNKVTVSFDRDDLPNTHEQLLVGGATLQLNTIVAATNVPFTINSVNYTYTVAVDATTHVVTLDFKGASGGTLTSVQAEALLDALKYSNTSDDPTGSPRVFSLSVTDAGGLSSNTATSTITVTPVNDPPVLDLDADNSSTATGADYRGSFRVGGTSAAIADVDSAVTDLDNANIASATIVLTNAKVGDSLSFSGTFGAITATVPATATADGTLTLTLTGSATKADYEAAIEAIRFAATGTNYTDRVFDVTLSDGSAVSNTATATLAVLPDNRALSVTGTEVNEVSPFVLFTVTGVSGQRVSLELAATSLASGNAALGVDTANPTNATLSTTDDVPLQYLNSSNQWVDYVPGTTVALSGTTLLVRTAVVNDMLNEGTETLRLIARNDAGGASATTGSTSTDGVARIRDDGQGNYFPAANTDTTSAALPAGTFLNDDRPLTVSSVTVNEASPYATFTVTGANGQKVLLDLANASGDAPTDTAGGKAALGTPTLEYFDGTWKTYDASNPPAITSGTTLLVRVGITAERDTALDGPETFNLVATNTGGTSGTGEATIVDDGTGSWFDYANASTSTPLSTPAASALDDDRLLNVNSITVNEASPYATFTVSGAAGQYVTLALASTSSANFQGQANADLGNAGTGVPLQYFDGSTWLDYSPGDRVQIPTTGTTLLVRTAIVQDTNYEGAETFRLQATNTGGTSTLTTEGIATIKDDGTGSIYKYSSNSTATPLAPSDANYPVLDDDRLLTVSNVTVNEGSPYAVFTVTGPAAGQPEQKALLSLANASGNGSPDAAGGAAALGTNPALQYFEGGVWKTYNASNPPVIAGGASLLVRVAINAEQEAALDGPETFSLVATNTGGMPNDTSGSDKGLATIVDNGTGDYFAATNNTATPAVPTGVVLDDDRVLTIGNISVNEGSPYAVFTVSGAASQLVSLTLTNGTTTGLSGLQYYNAAANGGAGGWVTYTGGNVALDGSGKLLVRTALTMEQEAAVDNGETFTLTATNTAGTSNDTTGADKGIATVHDDGTGTYYPDAAPTSGAPTTSTSAVLDDDRPLTVSSVTVNEASPYATFTVTGANGQKVLLDLANASGTSGNANLLGDYDNNPATANTLPPLQYFEGGIWKTYNASNPPAITSGTTLLVRVGITAERDTALDGPETFNLVATNTGGTSGTGAATILDDGTGKIFLESNNTATPDDPTAVGYTGPVLDDDRLLSVNSITVNEASPYATFTVSGAAGQYVTLALASTSSANLQGQANADLGDAGTGVPLQYFDGSTWLDYSPGDRVQIPTTGTTLLVRTAIVQDTNYEGAETFRLQATNTGGTSTLTTEGIATIKDDGTGSIYKYSSNSTATPLAPSDANYPVLDDDRLLTVSNVTVNEGSPYAVFTVTGATGQTVKLNLDNAAATNPITDATGGNAALSTTLPALEYLEGGVWKTYDATNPPKIASGATTLLVRVAISAEQEAALDGPETFNLVATNTGGTSSPLTQGVATIRDDGQGDYFAASNNTAASSVPTGVALDDDRPVTITSPTVNEASPFAVFTLDGEPGQLVSLNLAAGTAAGNLDFQTKVEYSTDGGQTWTLYTGGNIALNGTGGTALVRVPIVNDSTQEPDETFTLTATNTGGTTVVGTATIQDDGNGTIFNDNGTVNTAAVKDDDRPLTIAPVTVNEASPWAVFTVSGAANQLAALSLANVTTTGLSGLEYFAPTLVNGQPRGWTAYTSGNVPLDANGELLVRVAINPERDTLLDGPETFNLVATNTGGVSGTGVGTIVDDGSGDYVAFGSNTSPAPLAQPAASTLDDDRPLRVDNITVNEGSPKAVFSVMGAAGQYVKLALSDGTAKVDANGTPVTDGSEDYGPALEVFLNGGWTVYNPANFVQIPAGGTLLVRTAIINDSSWENAQTFQLTATNTGGTPDTGVATIMDDGTGDYWIGDATAPATSAQLDAAHIALDDDRPIMVTGGTYNEGSPRAVFEVEAHAGQLLTLAVEDVRTDGLSSALVYYSIDGGANWVRYNGTPFVAGPVHVLVAVDITGEADAPYEVSEEFRLVVNKNQTTQASASAFIVDDGTGNIAPEITEASDNVANPMADLGGIKDDDRAVTVNSPTVNEASPFAVFTVKGGANQRVTLALSDGTAVAADYGPSLQVSADGGQTWLPYTTGTVALNGDGELLVRTPVRQDSNYERAETFTLTATNGSGVPAPGTATIVDDGTGTIFNDNGSENTTATRDDDRPVAPLVEPAPAPAPSVVPPAPAPTAPSLHVQFAVADARAATSGASSMANSASVPVSSAGAVMLAQALNAQAEKFDRTTDPNLFVLPEVRSTRSQSFEAASPAYALQSGLLAFELTPANSLGVSVQLSHAPTSADQTLAAMAEEALAQPAAARVQLAELDEQETAELLARKQALHLAAAREAARLDAQTRATAPARGQFGFSRQLQMSAAQRQAATQRLS